MPERIEWDQCLVIVEQEVRRVRPFGPYSRDDLRQELSIAAFQCLDKIDTDKGAGAGYVRTSVRNAVKSLRERVYAAKRHPQDKYGQTLPFASEEVIEFIAAEPTTDADDRIAAREVIDQLTDTEREKIISAWVDGARLDKNLLTKVEQLLSSIQLREEENDDA
jgi:DNA-directed RNA polymerase specialized sigma24 family protein